MAQRILATWGFIVAGVLFLIAALIPVIRGGNLKPVNFVLAVVFLMLGAAAARKRRGDGPRVP